jgi:D-hexose-6-phosphate mutarotase
MSDISTLLNTVAPSITVNKRGELDCLEVRHPAFNADLLMQGAQLLHYAPARSGCDDETG